MSVDTAMKRSVRNPCRKKYPKLAVLTVHRGFLVLYQARNYTTAVVVSGESYMLKVCVIEWPGTWTSFGLLGHTASELSPVGLIDDFLIGKRRAAAVFAVDRPDLTMATRFRNS